MMYITILLAQAIKQDTGYAEFNEKINSSIQATKQVVKRQRKV